MFFLFKSAVVISAIITNVISAPISCDNGPEPHVSYTPANASSKFAVHRLFTDRTYGFENLYARANGQLLVTAAFPTARIWQVDPLSILPPIMLQEFPSFTGTLGITELMPDMFYIVLANNTKPGSGSIFSVDMRRFLVLPNGTVSTPPVVREVAHLPSSVALNGMTHMAEGDDFVLTADSTLGGIWKTNVETGNSTIIIKDPTMNPLPNTVGVAAYAVNGIRVQNNTLYYTNSGAQTLHRMPVILPSPFSTLPTCLRNSSDSRLFLQLHPDGSSAGPAGLIASPIYADDFAIDQWGFLYMASPANALLRVDSRTGQQTVLAGNFNSSTSDIVGPTSVRFGRGVSDRSSVYLSTNGGSFSCAPPGSQGVSRVDVRDLAQIFG